VESQRSGSFKELKVRNWRQFRSAEIKLHPRLTVITGANGSGKSTLLNIFSQHFGWNRTYLSTPIHEKKSGYLKYLIGRFGRRNLNPNDNSVVVGSLSYANGAESNLYVIEDPRQPQYHLHLQNPKEVHGLFIASHRPLPVYQQVLNIPTNVIDPQKAYSHYHSETLKRWTGTHSQFSPTYRLKESLISMATFGAGNQYVKGNRVVLDAFLGFSEILKKVLPKSLGFIRISIRTPEVVLVTESGDFLLDASSGGIMALIDLAWQIHIFSMSLLAEPGDKEFVVTIDEPENHLHPSMQRSLMANLLDAFPQVQFIIATHSPFMVSSVKDSRVYVLDYMNIESEGGEENLTDDEISWRNSRARRVVSQELDNINRAGTASEILREVLGVPATVPAWVEDEVKRITDEHRDLPFSAETLHSLRVSLANIGCAEFYADSLSKLIEKAERPND